MENKLYEEIKKLKGNALCICVSREIEEALSKSKVTQIGFLEFKTIKNKKIKSKKVKNENGININIKKLRKHFKRNSVNNIICNYDEIKKFKNRYIKENIFINDKYTYLYGKDIDIEEIEKKYKRYNASIEILESKNKKLIKINNTNSKSTKYKDFIYNIVDAFETIIDFVADLLMN